MLNASLKFEEQNFKFGGWLNRKQNQKVKKHWFYKQNNSSARASDFLVQPTKTTTALHVHHAFWQISLMWTTRPRRETSHCEVGRSEQPTNLDRVLKNSTAEQFVYNWQIERGKRYISSSYHTKKYRLYNSKPKTLKTGRERLWNGSRTEQKEHKHKVRHLLLNLCERLRLGHKSFISNDRRVWAACGFHCHRHARQVQVLVKYSLLSTCAGMPIWMWR